MKFKNVIFDLDSTLTKIEGLDFLAYHKGLGDKVRGITAAGMNGDLPFSQSLQRRLDIVQPTWVELIWLGEKYIENLIEDAQEVVRTLMDQGRQVFILTGALRPAAVRCGAYLGIEENRITAISFLRKSHKPDIVNYIGKRDLDGFKVSTVQKIKQLGTTVLVGDGVTDLAAGKIAELFIGFGGVVFRERVKRESPIYIEEPRLQGVLDYVL